MIVPLIFKVDENLLDNICTVLRDVTFKKALIISGTNISRNYAYTISKKIIGSKLIHSLDNSLSTVTTVKKIIEQESYDLVISVGGGKIADLGKRISYESEIPNIIFPTLISNDGLVSPISVLKDSNNKTNSMKGSMPIGVIIDLNIIMNSPNEYLLSAACDLISNISATEDWILSQAKSDEKINDFSFLLARGSANSLLLMGNNFDITNKSTVRQIILSQINSGIAMSFSGNSRPCSGAEHIISHAIDFLSFSKHLHGIQVAILSLFTLFLHRKENSLIYNYINLLNIPLYLDILENKEIALKIFKTSREMRPGRVTILDNYTDTELYLKHNEFIISTKSKHGQRI
jgi:glycerol-1-phosphate dehydrogenase [NAD(P)+]